MCNIQITLLSVALYCCMHSCFVLLCLTQTQVIIYFSDIAFQSSKLDSYDFYSVPLHIKVHYSQETHEVLLYQKYISEFICMAIKFIINITKCILLNMNLNILIF